MKPDMNFFRAFVFLLVTFAAQCKAGGLDVAESFLSQIERFSAISANFTQRIIDHEGTVLQETSGELLIERPQNIRWLTNPPFEQLVVGNSEYLWVFDPDLEQATRYPGEKVLEGPLSLLMQSAESLAEKNDVSLFVQGKSEFYSLKPIESIGASNFNELEFVFNDGTLGEIKMTDKLDQVSAITFSEVLLDPELKSEIFQFSAPEGADLIINE